MRALKRLDVSFRDSPLADERGATLLEYCLLAAILVVIVAAAASRTEEQVGTRISTGRETYRCFDVPDPSGLQTQCN